MISVIVERLPRVEGDLEVLLSQTESGNQAILKSGRSTHLTRRLIGTYPLEAPHLTQALSSNTCVAHAIASVSALEDYLRLYPTETGLRIRQVMLDMSAIRAHLYHFYWQVLPNYLNSEHYKLFAQEENWYFLDFTRKQADAADLPNIVGWSILQNISNAARVIDLLQKNLTLLGGKFPVIMNQIPGGITNVSIERSLNMSVIRNLELCKEFIEEIWPHDVKTLIRYVPETKNVLGKEVNLISFGSLVIEKNRGKTSTYSEGVLLGGKLEPVNDLKITESLDQTFYIPIDKEYSQQKEQYDYNKPDARTWIKGARYEGQPMLTGALSRMMVTHLAGGNLEISDKIGQMIEDLGLTFEAPSCIASRLLAEVIESRITLKNVFKNLFDVGGAVDTNRKTSFDFSAEGVGIGKTESPGGSLLHQVFVKDERIVNYRIVSSVNWNFAPADNEGKSGEVEYSLNTLLKSQNLDAIGVSRILHSYYPLILDGTQ